MDEQNIFKKSQAFRRKAILKQYILRQLASHFSLEKKKQIKLSLKPLLEAKLSHLQCTRRGLKSDNPDAIIVNRKYM